MIKMTTHKVQQAQYIYALKAQNEKQIYPLAVNRKRSHGKTLAQSCATF